MAQKNLSALGIVPSALQLEGIVANLGNAGFRPGDISVIYPDRHGDRDFLHEKNSKAPEGAVVGGGTGAVLGGTLGLLLGLGALAIPGLGPVMAAGPIMAALAGMGAGGTLGGVAGALVGWGIPEFEAKRYEGLVEKGGILVSAHADDKEWGQKAEEILIRGGATDVVTASEARVRTAEGML